MAQSNGGRTFEHLVLVGIDPKHQTAFEELLSEWCISYVLLSAKKTQLFYACDRSWIAKISEFILRLD